MDFCYFRPVRWCVASHSAVRSVALLGGLSALGLARAAAPASVHVACPPLSLEQRSSLEARLRADLTMERIFDAELRVSCEGTRAVVAFARAGQPLQLRSAELSPDASGWVEEILALSHLLTSPSEPQPATSEPKLDERASTSFPSEASPSSPPAAVEADAASPTPTPPSSPPLARRSASNSQSDATSPYHSESSGRRDGRPLFEVGVGAAGEIWANELFGTVGPSFALGARFSPLLRLGLFADLAWGTARPSDLGLFAYRLGAEARFGQRFWLGVGVSVTGFEVTAASQLSPVDQSALDPTLTSRIGYSIVLGQQALSLSAGLRASPKYHDVELNGQRQYRLPLVAPSLGVEYSLGL